VSTGSGFFVSPAGHVLTNEHVVSKCREVRVAGARSARRIATDGNIDLALLKVIPSKPSAATFRSGRGVRTGDDIIVAGYPLHGLLSSELNVTKGIVSALTGPADDRRIMQITAPVQPGNSGGPAFDSSGNVVGVVVARLDALKMVRRTGRLPQNVNFAIRASLARSFLDTNNVDYDLARSDRALSVADIGEQAQDFTVLILCYQ
ncbi:MAG: trypsin-like peptidase domain-containing protein, partial [Proteobacteria bacterium]|nr:trypsin-like peptidase domain-containing protein [Pseudomonadota bacterium]